MTRIKAALKRARSEIDGNLLPSEYEQALQLWTRAITERQREYVASRPLVEIKSARRKSRKDSAFDRAVTT
jgi:hypothetical protein